MLPPSVCAYVHATRAERFADMLTRLNHLWMTRTYCTQAFCPDELSSFMNKNRTPVRTSALSCDLFVAK